ncbi:MAG: hypothetical protein IKW28_06305 [Lachnospiraceae bacterium]|nr:hypothetical protein [Lachnospiraceae bacterium]
MEEERLVVLEAKKGVRYAVLQEEKNGGKLTEEKAKKMEALLKLLIRQSVTQTIEEYHVALRDDIREELSRSEEKLEEIIRKNTEEENKRWKKLEEHFIKVDKLIREKQKQGKRKKHSIF